MKAGDVVAGLVEVDLHGYHPSTINEKDLIATLVREAWEMGKSELRFIHGHGLNRHNPRPFANTNTGSLGLTVRGILRNDRGLRQWIYAKLDVSDFGTTTVRLKPNPSPNRSDFDELPDSDF